MGVIGVEADGREMHSVIGVEADGREMLGVIGVEGDGREMLGVIGVEARLLPDTSLWGVVRDPACRSRSAAPQSTP